MRTKEEILKTTGDDILSEQYKENAHLWVQCRLIEVLIDIRDQLTAFVKHHQDHWEQYHGAKGGDGNDED